ncbi:5'-nucleotidase /3'-nucleotidase /exopolyphosphatase [Enhydrobacter aerosaccus]|uniref:5'-nucleotidase SurE n=1 Tax=Enhydrobacter aerosaccus TaxID=225324 RepID=A0A1T4THR2_9HYPH|nr:5'-nucleotidase /3'-nucleotidase /exopolyphosphatase [Enhydrobacter aerosaccus]
MKPLNLAKARILVTNDDGINAPGLDALIDIASQLSTDVWIVAPEFNQSGAGHSLSLTHPVRARQVTEKRFALEGTPTDCVLFAVKHLLKDRKPDIVLSGVNRGSNMADDVTYSGTIAGAMEGCLLGIPSIAFSQAYTHPHPLKWETATQYGADIARRVLSMELPRNVLVNVNFPDVVANGVKGVKITRQGVRAFGGHIVERTDPRGGTYYWIAYAPGEHEHDEESDITAVRSGWISVTPLHLDLTHEATRRKLAHHFEMA